MIVDSLSMIDDSTTRGLLLPAPPHQAPPALPQRTRRPRSLAASAGSGLPPFGESGIVLRSCTGRRRQRAR
jgi:hypothetical protein